MNKTMSKKISMTLVAIMALFYGFANFASASNDNHKFKMIVKPYWMNSQNYPGRFRDTTNPLNPWKVNLKHSEEGKGTITDFWLENYNDDNVSKTMSVHQGKGAKYCSAYKNASQTKVWLTCENNNFNDEAYNISGYWDEETWD